jgi:hypothetical protein
MPTETLSAGPVHSILQNVVYAMPPRTVLVTSSVAVETSLNGTVWTALASGTNSSAPFLRCPTANATVTCKIFK